MRRASILAILAAAALVAPAHAQQAPIGQADIGRAGNADGGGGGASVPLDLPAERHGLPIPVSLVFDGSNRVGDAGVGWSVPLSLIGLNDTFSRQRPRNTLSFSPPTNWAPDDKLLGRASLALLGQASALVPVDASGRWKALVGDQTLDVQKTASGWDAVDGGGVHYRFANVPGLGNPSLYLLTEIASGLHPQSKVQLGYRVTARSVAGLGAPELELTSVAYNFDDAGACAKNEIVLDYAPRDAKPLLGVFVDNGRLRVRTEVLAAITVRARGASCGASPIALRRYELRYADDIDSAQPRLVDVNLIGRDGTAEARPFPVARYVYGRSSWNGFFGGDRGLIYGERGDPLPLPAGRGDLGAVGPVGGPTFQATHSMLADLDGDGLPDYLADGTWYRNSYAAGFQTGQAIFPGVSSPPDVLNWQTTYKEPGRYPAPADMGGVDATVHENTFLEVIDMNGDGRVDVVDARKSYDRTWRIYLNEPDGWRVIDVDMSGVYGRLLGDSRDDLPIVRSATGQEETLTETCTSTQVGPQQYAWTSCDVYPLVGLQTSRVEWMLRDVNGDGYPDIVANSRKSILHRAGGTFMTCAELQASTPIGPGIMSCRDEWRFEYEPGASNQLIVFYNVAGARLGSQTPFADAVPLGPRGGCSVEEYTEAEAGSTQSCGFVELNGDGILDRIEYGHAWLGTGDGDDALHPGAVGYVPAPGLVLPSRDLRNLKSDYKAKCVDTPGGTEFTSTAYAGYLDVNGDGIADHVNGNKVQIGTGAGFAEAIDFVAGGTTPVLSESTVLCAGKAAKTIKGLFDIDGDGRVDYLEVEGGKVHVYSLYEPTGEWGALAGGRITEEQNGAGATKHDRYRSLKRDGVPGHAIPGPEVAPSRTWITHDAGGDGPDVAATTFDYGGARLWFDTVADRWVFPGYERSVAVQGTTTKDGDQAAWGTAVIQDTWRPEDLVAGVARNTTIGRPRRITRLAGSLPTSPGHYIGADLTKDASWRGQEDIEYAQRTSQLTGYISSIDDCLSMPQPWETTYVGTSDGDADPRCRMVAHAYPKTVTARRGKGAPAYTGDGFVETKEIVVDTDGYGQPTVIQHAGDTSKPDDDVCEVRNYAAPVPGGHVLRAIAQVHLYEPVNGGEFALPTCSGMTKIIAGARFGYDHLPVGQVALGLRTDDIVERRDPASGALLDQFTQVVRWFDARSNLTVLQEETGQGLLRRTDISGYDGFGLVPGTIAVSAADVAVTLADGYSYDAYTLAVLDSTAPTGLVEHARFDGLGRPVRSSLTDPRDGREYITATLEYLGATQVSADVAENASATGYDVIDPLGTRVRSRVWSDAVLVTAVDPTAATPTPAETMSTSFHDYLGRTRRIERMLGADYGGGVLVLDEATRDGLGLPHFVAAPYLAGSGGVRYGTTYFRDADGSVSCAVLGRGESLIPQTSQGVGSPGTELEFAL